MSNPIQLLRSTTPGNTPSSLLSGQIAINEADGILFWNQGGTVKAFKLTPAYSFWSSPSSASGTFSAVAGGQYLVDLTSASATANLPASPNDNDAVKFIPRNGGNGARTLTINGNGHNIEGASTFVIDYNIAAIVARYSATTTAWFVE